MNGLFFLLLTQEIKNILARISQIELTEEQEEWLDEITAFNLNTRYDNYKQEFRTRCTKEYRAQWINNITQLSQVLTRGLPPQTPTYFLS